MNTNAEIGSSWNGRILLKILYKDSDTPIINKQDIKDQNQKGRVFIGENEAIEVYHGKVFHLADPVEAAQWDAIKYSPLIAGERTEKDINGNYLIDGANSVVDRYGNAKGTYGIAELYIERPGIISKAKNDKRKQILKAMSLVADDSLDHRVMICKLFEKNKEVEYLEIKEA